MNRIYPEHWTRVSDIARITDRNGLMTTGWSKTHATRRMGCKRLAGDRFAPSPYGDEVVHQPDSMTPGMDVVETQDYGPPGIGYPMVNQSGLFF